MQNNFQSPSHQPLNNEKPNFSKIVSEAKKNLRINKLPRPEIDIESSFNPKQFLTSPTTTDANLPPPSYTNYVSSDNGNANPRFLRSSVYEIPTEKNAFTKTKIPLGLIIQPFADLFDEEEPVPMIDPGENGPFRCSRCQTYVNPNWIFTEANRVVICNICKMNNQIPQEYFDYCLPGNAKPELQKGVYEYFMSLGSEARTSAASNIIFCIEVSSDCYINGVFHQILFTIQSLLDYMPSPELTNICIVTYDFGVNFYKIPDDLTQQMRVYNFPDTETTCFPFPPAYLFLNLQNERSKIDLLIEKITSYYDSNMKDFRKKGPSGGCFATALVDCCNFLTQNGGRVLTFTTQIPLSGQGKLQKRDDYKLYGTDNEKILYVPQSEEYRAWAQTWLQKRITVDIFCFAPEYFDITTIGQVCSITGGNFYYYPTFQSAYDGEKLHYDLSRNLTRSAGYDAVMTVRVSQGIKLLDYIGPSGRQSNLQLEFSSVNSDTTICAYFNYDESNLKESTSASFQAAILYTNNLGQRILRILNLKVGISKDIVSVYHALDLEAASQLIFKRNFLHISTLSIPQIRKDILQILTDIFANYYSQADASPNSSIPKPLKLFPIYFLSALKLHILRLGGDTRPDDRAYDLLRFMKMPLPIFSNILYPKLYQLDTLWVEDNYSPGSIVGNKTILPYNLPVSKEFLKDNGIYLLDNSEFLFLYIKENAHPVLIQNLLGVESFQEIVTTFPDYVESEYFTKVANIIAQLRKNKNSSYQALRIVTQNDPSEPYLLGLLIEDSVYGDSYKNFLSNLDNQVLSKLSM